ncbi:MAG: hypothetical protein RMY64_14660 [Nostoc sp. DedQUE08]|uniref:hypothetical protein n=1 Tax=unclassified Nostoc TaxID=2593658 RepID=UPI002AD3933B|nr:MULTISPECIES: hypothetical protein [unclassified Nostoc]MDZ8031353.1 hypothetical protein [Nostoc sp. DedSLP04]MDZ8066838.1 hypothetical protein [Nostoc sp. DedQUE08]MDZ8094747.1 hypothetical protein [Nostoc sp. DedQUE05]MDZ8130122.1 hypothetical protein [Nostoc sp. DedQUE07]MDZ8134135.1 hypothetical protein [Nostoc sp. DedQUE04]
MGRWTPLILMAGGLAILLGTLLGINFPMGVQTANAPSDKKSEVLPANINVNSSAGSKNEETATEGNETTETNQNRRSIVAPRPDNRSNVAQNSGDDSTSPADTTTENNTDSSGTSTPSSDTNQSNEPIRALW